MLAGRLRDLADYVERTDQPDWRWLRVELEAMAKTMYRQAGESAGGTTCT